MNKTKLKQAEMQFLDQYPNGFMHPEMQQMGRKHKMDQMIELTQQCFKKSRFKDHREITQSMVKIINRSSMISMFEKPKFKTLINSLNDKDTRTLSLGLKNRLHGNHQRGFETMLGILLPVKLAKWSLISVLPNYYFPDDEVFIKPTTTKSAIDYFELKNLHYHPTPSWAFYQDYKSAFLTMKNTVDKSLAPNNAAFGGFLMMATKA